MHVPCQPAYDCQPMTVLTCYSCLLCARPVHVTLLSHQPTDTGQARLLWLNLHNKPPYPLYPLRVTSHVISPLSHSASHHFHNDWDRMDTNSRYRESINTPTGTPCISNTRISCIYYTQVPQYYTRLSLQAVCWMMLATGALAITAVFISSICSLFYLIYKCRLPY